MSRDIFIVSNSTDELGGVTAWTHQTARLFTEQGHRVHVIGIHASDRKMALPAESGYPVTALYPAHPPTPWTPHGIRDRFRIPTRRREAARAERKRRAVARLSELFATARPGAVVVVTQVWAMEWVGEADTTGLRVIGMSHESYDYSRASHRYRWIKNHYRDIDHWLVLTEEDADRWAGDGFDNVGFLPNALARLPHVPSPPGRGTAGDAGRPDRGGRGRLRGRGAGRPGRC
ncbi:glycosyltransferase family 4 protein, partial [Streptomyces cyaneofuscatus]